MKQRAPTAIAAILATGALGVAIALGAFGSDTDGAPTRGGAPAALQVAAPGTPPGGRPQAGNPRPLPALPRRPRSGRYFAIVELNRGAEVPLLSSPGGALIESLSARSEFGSPRVLGVARQKGSWLGVISPLLRNGELGWIRFDASKLTRYWTRYSLSVSLSQRSMTLRYGGREFGRFTVSVGAAGSDTPPGRFAITDALAYDDSPYYGCCALALSGHQERLPVGWIGGDRIAIHGTPGPVGYAASSGCIRATDETMRTLFRRVPLGTPVFVNG